MYPPYKGCSNVPVVRKSRYYVTYVSRDIGVSARLTEISSRDENYRGRNRVEESELYRVRVIVEIMGKKSIPFTLSDL